MRRVETRQLDDARSAFVASDFISPSMVEKIVFPDRVQFPPYRSSYESH